MGCSVGVSGTGRLKLHVVRCRVHIDGIERYIRLYDANRHTYDICCLATCTSPRHGAIPDIGSIAQEDRGAVLRRCIVGSRF